MIYDKLNRPIHDLRISVIDRCNFRCPYCMPDQESKHYSFLKKEEWLTFEEILRLVGLFVQVGVKKVRLTGGEPLLRPKLADLVQELSHISGIEDLALTTNGSLLEASAHELKKSGLKRLTVSLDTLDSRIFKHLSGQKGSVSDVLNGIKAAENAGFESIKINVVIQKGVNDTKLLDLVEYFRGTKHVIRFIEYMDVGNCNHWESRYVVPSKEILAVIQEKYPLKPLDSNYYGEVAERYEFLDGQGEIGFISSVSQPFCQSCTRARLSTDGKFYTCLFASDGTDLRALLRQGASDEVLLNTIKTVWQKRTDRYSELRDGFNKISGPIIPSEARELKDPSASRPQDEPFKNLTRAHPHKVEMFQVGG